MKHHSVLPIITTLMLIMFYAIGHVINYDALSFVFAALILMSFTLLNILTHARATNRVNLASTQHSQE